MRKILLVATLFLAGCLSTERTQVDKFTGYTTNISEFVCIAGAWGSSLCSQLHHIIDTDEKALYIRYHGQSWIFIEKIQVRFVDSDKIYTLVGRDNSSTRNVLYGSWIEEYFYVNANEGEVKEFVDEFRRREATGDYPSTMWKTIGKNGYKNWETY